MMLIILEWIAVIGNLGSIVLNIRKNLWCWPIRIVTGIILALINYHSGHTGQLFFWAVFVVLSTYGWIVWRGEENAVH